jgi:hypothetical protein
MGPLETSEVAGSFPYERPSIVVIQPDGGEQLNPMTILPVVFAIVLVTDVATWGVAVHTLTKATKTTTTGGPLSGPPEEGPTLVTMAGLPVPEQGPESKNGN